MGEKLSDADLGRRHRDADPDGKCATCADGHLDGRDAGAEGRRHRRSTRAAFVAGHSLGEYSALCAAGTLSLADTARLLRIRGQAMQAAVPVGEGAMAAMLGLDSSDVDADRGRGGAKGEVCAGRPTTTTRRRTSCRATRPRSSARVDLAKDAGAKRALLLPVSAPFHCALMAPAADEMAQALGEVDIDRARRAAGGQCARPQAVDDPGPIRALLVEQVTGRVRWRSSVEWMVGAGRDRILGDRCGQGAVGHDPPHQQGCAAAQCRHRGRRPTAVAKLIASWHRSVLKKGQRYV